MAAPVATASSDAIVVAGHEYDCPSTSHSANSTLSEPSTSAVQREQVQLLASLIDKAAQAYAQGRLQQSLDHYEQAVQIDPVNNVLYANRSAILLKLGRVVEAVAEAARAIQLRPEWPKAYFRKGEALKEAAEYEKAIICYCQAIQASPDSDCFLNALVGCASKSAIGGQFERALVQMRQVGLDRSAFVIVSVLGQEFLQQRRFDTAIATLKIALNIDSPSLKLKESTLGALSKAYYETHNMPKATDYLELQLELVIQLKDVKAQIEVHGNIADVALAMADYQLATVHRDAQLQLCEKTGHAKTEIYNAKAAISDCQRDYESALRFYEAALTEQPDNFEANMGVGNILLKRDEVVLAEVVFAKTRALAPTPDHEVLALIRLCQCKLIQGETENAIRLLKANLKTEKPLNPKALGNIFGMLCKTACASGDMVTLYRMAKRQLKLAIKTEDSQLKAEAFYSLSLFYQQTNHEGNAKRLLELYFETVEQHNLAQPMERQIERLAELGRIEARLGNLETATRLAHRRLELANQTQKPELKATGHADLISIFRKLKNSEEREKHISELKVLAAETRDATALQVSAIYEFELGELLMDQQRWTEAQGALERSLIMVQELDNDSDRESLLVHRLGEAYFHVGKFEDALAYMNQFLLLAQQRRSPEAMCKAYRLLAKVHLKREAWDEAHDAAKCYMSMSGILKDPKGKMEALLLLGKVFCHRCDWVTAVKVFSRARRIAETLDAKPELAMCFGHLGECQLKLSHRQKALSNFCKQLNLFPYIDSVADKCETISHLTTEKAEAKDVVWCSKLCRLQEEIARDGDFDLQIKVLRDCAHKMMLVGCLDDTTRCLEKALLLSIEHEHPDTVTILLDLCGYYGQLRHFHKSVAALREFADLQDGLCGPDVFYQLAVVLMFENKLDESIEQLEKCLPFDKVDNRFMYALACAHFRKGEYRTAYQWLVQYMEAALNDDEQREKLLWERCLLDFVCGSKTNIRDELALLIRTSDESWFASPTSSPANTSEVTEYLDEFNMYSLISYELIVFLPLRAQLHFSLMTGLLGRANDLLRQNAGLCDPFSFEAVALRLLLGVYDNVGFSATIFAPASAPSVPFLFRRSATELQRANAAVLAISSCHSPVESLRVVEVFRWMQVRAEFAKLGVSYSVMEPTTADIALALTQIGSFVYLFQLDSVTLLWSKRNNEEKVQLRFHFSDAVGSLPLFHQQILRRILVNSDLREEDAENYERILANAQLIIDSASEVLSPNRMLSLVNLCQTPSHLPPETALLLLDSEPTKHFVHGCVEINSYASIPTKELVQRISQSAITYLNLDGLDADYLTVSDCFSSVMSAGLIILFSSTFGGQMVQIVREFLLTGCEYVVVARKKLSKELKYGLMNLIGDGIQTRISPFEFESLLEPAEISIFRTHLFPPILEVTGVSNVLRQFLLKNTLRLCADTELADIVSDRVAHILSLHNDNLSDDELQEIQSITHDVFPFQRISDFLQRYDDRETAQLLFADFLPLTGSDQNDRLTSVELLMLMKSFEVRAKWRRRRKAKSVVTYKEYHSDGERANYSDKDLTDTESVSGARVIGIDQDVDGSDFLF